MHPLPELETTLRLAHDKGDREHPCGVSLASYFVRARTRGRRRAELEPELLFSRGLRQRMGESAQAALEQAMDPRSFRACTAPLPALPTASREWLAEAALALGREQGFTLTWSLLRAMSELELVSQRLLGARTPRAVVRQVLHGVSARSLKAEPFAALLVRVLKIAQAVYAALRLSGKEHAEAWAAVEDRLWSAHPTGRRSASGAEARGAYLPSLVQAASGNARRRLRRSAEEGRGPEHARALLARFVSGPAARLWPWSDPAGKPLPKAEGGLTPELAAACFFVLLTHTASERRSRGGPSGGLSADFAEAGFASSEWLPDRSDDLAVRLLAAPEGMPRGELLDGIAALVRATLAGGDGLGGDGLGSDGVGGHAQQGSAAARERFGLLLRWLEENGRELLEAT